MSCSRVTLHSIKDTILVSSVISFRLTRCVPSYYYLTCDNLPVLVLSHMFIVMHQIEEWDNATLDA